MKEEYDLFSIGEAARTIGIMRRIILNYEDRGLVRPDVKDSATATAITPSTRLRASELSGFFKILVFLWTRSASILMIRWSISRSSTD